MPRDRRAAEARLEPLEERLGQRDFGQQDERLPALAKALRDRLEIDFGLARSGNSVEQHGVEFVSDRRREAGSGVALIPIEVGRREIWVGAGERPVGIDRHGFQRAGIDQAAHDAVADLGVAGELADRALAPVDRGKRLLALRREAFGNEPGRPILGELPRPVERGRRGQHHPQHRGERAQVIIRGPFAQPPERRGDRRDAHDAGERAQPAVRHFGRRQPLRLPRHAEQLARAERRDHDRAGLDMHVLGHPVIERPERGIQGDDTGALHC